MAQKQITIPEIGQVSLQKRRGSKSIRLTVRHDGTLRVSMPIWSPYKAGLAFALSKKDWIVAQQQNKSIHKFNHAERIGKNHRMRFVLENREKVSSRITKTEIIIRIPNKMHIEDEEIQKAINNAAVRALKQEAKHLLPQRLDILANLNGFTYRSLSIKRLKARWGSCSSHTDIALNCFLMQLPWELIDYVLLHELQHTQIMAHGKKFWDALDEIVTELPRKRKLIKSFQPILKPQD